ncbi:translation initiation factor eIF-2B subunit gamma [Agrilus planipennis]|uniref:Translation initiation factor eIF2B subunit gamma n=1 Tax=Agrilus planipennis TaxID=224129 RepID=A0A7F5RIP5_AGRPL|nr:translation initiation factor eIF-2B subunit gamma [Agrilus planipennis]
MFLQEFQAVILAAGKGSRFCEITSNKPKCLLPVGNKPLIWYSLHKLQQSGFKDVIVIVLENQKLEIQSTLDNYNLKINIEYVTIPGNEDLGTADSLKRISDKIKTDLFVVTCDIITDINFKYLVDLFRKHNASVCTLFLNPQQDQLVVPGPKSKYKPEKDLVGIDEQTNRLVFLASISDFENYVPLSRKLLRKHPHVKLHTNLIDSHVYIIKKWIVDYLQQEDISTLKGELLPHIVKKQLLKPTQSDTNASLINIKDKNDIFHFAKESELDLLIREKSTFNDHIGDLRSCYHDDVIRCYACIADCNSVGIRVNTLPSYWIANNKITEIWEKITNGEKLAMIGPLAEIKSTQVDNKCLIWDGSKLHEKTSFKNSTIGSNTEVFSFSRVFNSLVMNNVTIKEKVSIENCIICDGVTLENGSQLKNCVVGGNHTVTENSQHTNEVLTIAEQLMEF